MNLEPNTSADDQTSSANSHRHASMPQSKSKKTNVPNKTSKKQTTLSKAKVKWYQRPQYQLDLHKSGPTNEHGKEKNGKRRDGNTDTRTHHKADSNSSSASQNIHTPTVDDNAGASAYPFPGYAGPDYPMHSPPCASTLSSTGPGMSVSGDTVYVAATMPSGLAPATSRRADIPPQRVHGVRLRPEVEDVEMLPSQSHLALLADSWRERSESQDSATSTLLDELAFHAASEIVVRGEDDDDNMIVCDLENENPFDTPLPSAARSYVSMASEDNVSDSKHEMDVAVGDASRVGEAVDVPVEFEWDQEQRKVTPSGGGKAKLGMFFGDNIRQYC